MSKRKSLLLACATLAGLVAPAPADACGGFFCSAAPVDQSAERILFAVDREAGTTEMVVQITYQGEDEDFAWVLPVGEVPSDRAVVPNGALAPLDAQTGPTFRPDDQCYGPVFARGGAVLLGAGAFTANVVDEAAPPVVIHVQETVGPFDVVVLESPDADATFEWLTKNGYRLASAMKPYLELYTEEGMKFLALKLTADASVSDIQPFKMTFSGTTPSIPLRLTAIAAEPEMGIVTWILGDQRYEPANAPEIEIDNAELRWKPNVWPLDANTNWTQLVARAVDEQGGRGWVVEQAGSSEQIQTFLEDTFTRDEEQEAARRALLDLFKGKPYLTRLYTRVSPEEMSYDPIFKRSAKPDVPRERQLPYVEELCDFEQQPPPWTPCDFAACGQLGLCLPVETQDLVACACAPGATARTTFDPAGQVTVACQDQRMSFMNPGEKDESGDTFTDPCVDFSCGDHGHCVSMNLTPTCECEEGYVAVGSLSAQGQRETRCVKPTEEVPKAFYNRRPPKLAVGMVAGRPFETEPAEEPADQTMPDSYGDPRPASPPDSSGMQDRRTSGGVATSTDTGQVSTASEVEDNSGCAVSSSETGGLASWLLGLIALGFRRRRAA